MLCPLATVAIDAVAVAANTLEGICDLMEANVALDCSGRRAVCLELAGVLGGGRLRLAGVSPLPGRGKFSSVGGLFCLDLALCNL